MAGVALSEHQGVVLAGYAAGVHAFGDLEDRDDVLESLVAEEVGPALIVEFNQQDRVSFFKFELSVCGCFQLDLGVWFDLADERTESVGHHVDILVEVGGDLDSTADAKFE